jgi:hypothetical protein
LNSLKASFLLNLAGTVLIDILAVFSSIFLIGRANKRRAAVGRREMQIFLGTYLLVSFCDLFTTGRFLHVSNDLAKKVLLGFTSIQLGFTTAMFWILVLFGLVGYQLLDDGTPLSLGLVVGSAAILFTGTTYIALDTAFSFTGHFQPSKDCMNVGLYILYLGLPLVCMVALAILHASLILQRLSERIPLWYVPNFSLIHVCMLLTSSFVAADTAQYFSAAQCCVLS